MLSILLLSQCVNNIPKLTFHSKKKGIHMQKVEIVIFYTGPPQQNSPLISHEQILLF